MVAAIHILPDSDFGNDKRNWAGVLHAGLCARDGGVAAQERNYWDSGSFSDQHPQPPKRHRDRPKTRKTPDLLKISARKIKFSTCEGPEMTTDTSTADEYTPADLAADVRTLRGDPASMEAAEALLSRLRNSLADISPVTIALLAVQRNPGRVVDAIALLDADFVEVFAHMAETSFEIAEAEAAERTRLAPLLAEAAQRVLEGTARLENIPAELAYVASIPEAARAKYESAGLSAAEIAGLTQKLTDDNAQRAADLKEEQARLAAEIETLGEFLRTRDESALPEDFAPRQPVPGVTYRPTVAHHG